MAKAAEIQVEGMRELRRAFREFDTSDWRPHIKDAFGAVATVVEQRAQARAFARTNPRMGAEAAGSIRGKGTTTAATLTAFKGVAHGPGHEFGSHRYRQFPAVQRGGYNLYPAIDDERARIADEFADAIESALERAFPE